MDLFAYSQIDDLSGILASTGIEIPRLRGLRLMADEKKITKEELKKEIDSVIASEEADIVEHLIRACPAWSLDPCCTEYSWSADRRVEKFIKKEKVKEVDEDGREWTTTISHVMWEKLHGKKRKAAKFAIKKKAKKIKASMEAFNEYAGRDDVLCVHARIGGWNWKAYGGDEIEKSGAFLEKVDDWFDETYCDVYLRVDEGVMKEWKEKNKEEKVNDI